MENKKNMNDGSDDWTATQDEQLQAALKQYPISMEKNERWKAIAEAVGNKTKTQCVQRFKFIRSALLLKQSSSRDKQTAVSSPSASPAAPTSTQQSQENDGIKHAGSQAGSNDEQKCQLTANGESSQNAQDGVGTTAKLTSESIDGSKISGAAKAKNAATVAKPSNANGSKNQSSGPDDSIATITTETKISVLQPSQIIRGDSGGGIAISNKPPNAKNNNKQKQQQQSVAPKGDKKNQTKRKKKKKAADNRTPTTDHTTNIDSSSSSNNNNSNKDTPKQPQQQQNQEDKKKLQRKKKNQRDRKRKQLKKYPWRKHLPDNDVVDPITLDPLATLTYPPFCLAATEPYIPIPEWPIPDNNTDNGDQKRESSTKQQQDPEKMEEERQQRIICEQWGKKLTVSKSPASDSKQQSTTAEEGGKEDNKQRPQAYNLFDGRALAYYMVSQLQFIDPLNRRDLTRDELLNLDHYLRRHGFRQLRVVEAYDIKGVTISSAGAAAHTEVGRAEILQQEAETLLSALFGGRGTGTLPVTISRNNNGNDSNRVDSNTGNELTRQYQAHQSSQPQQYPRQGQINNRTSNHNTNVDNYTEDGGLLIIDDDENPGLRGLVPASVAYSASHIRQRHGNSPLDPESDFPSLSSTATATATTTSNAATNDQTHDSNKRPKPATKTLSKISGVIKKTDPEQQAKQWQARELALKKAALSNLTFGSNTVAAAQTQPPSLPAPTGAQLERNTRFAQALGVGPETKRQVGDKFDSSLVRSMALDECGNATVYSDELILLARDRMGAVLKLEKKWKDFVQDKNSPSLSLNSMDRESRNIVHEYAGHWKMQTESYDPEPRRYVHCVKRLDTSKPHPLLSEATKKWHGPRLRVIPSTDQQIGGQSEKVQAIAEPGPRFSALSGGRERPKLDLQKRTLPTELPPYERPIKNDADIIKEVNRSKAREEEKVKRQQEDAERKRRALEAAFASDDEREDDAYDSSEWSEEEELYSGDD